VPGSWRKINYDLRPAKNIERKMLSEAFRCLTSFGSMSSYRYVGFGSQFFSDFRLFHRSLGITRMISIEGDREVEQRCDFNRPYGCIRLRFGMATSVLPMLEWNQKTILWLDYDVHLDPEVLADVKFACANAVSGSMIVVTVDTRVKPPGKEDDPDKRVSWLKECLGEKVPAGIRKKDLVGWGTAKVYRTIIDNEIRKTLSERNGTLPEERQIQYKQLFNFEYEDSKDAKMLTAGGLLYETRHGPLLEKSAVELLPFIRSDEEPFQIEVPNLTLHEIRHLDKFLPKTPAKRLRGCPIPEIDVNRYSNLYRYFPSFVEAEL